MGAAAGRRCAGVGAGSWCVGVAARTVASTGVKPFSNFAQCFSHRHGTAEHATHVIPRHGGGNNGSSSSSNSTSASNNSSGVNFPVNQRSVVSSVPGSSQPTVAAATAVSKGNSSSNSNSSSSRRSVSSPSLHSARETAHEQWRQQSRRRFQSNILVINVACGKRGIHITGITAERTRARRQIANRTHSSQCIHLVTAFSSSRAYSSSGKYPSQGPLPTNKGNLPRRGGGHPARSIFVSCFCGKEQTVATGFGRGRVQGRVGGGEESDPPPTKN